MRLLLLAYLLTICMVASSGQQNPTPNRPPELPDSVKCLIEYKADSIAMAGAHDIDSVYKKPRLIIGHIDLLPTSTYPVDIYTWWYYVIGKDTVFYDITLKH